MDVLPNLLPDDCPYARLIAATTEIYLNLSPEHVIKESIDKW